MATYYDILGVPSTATPEQIKKAYREQIKFFHPDVFDGAPEIAQAKTTQLNEAYHILSNPKRRHEYDDYLIRQSQAHRQAEAEYRAKKQAEAEREQSRKKWEYAQQHAEEAWSSANAQAEYERQQRKAKAANNAKKQSTFHRWCTVALAFICVALIITSINLGIQNHSISSQLLESQNQVDNLSSQLLETKSKFNLLQTQYRTANTELTFWRNSAVIVTIAGEKYHTYGCYHTTGSSYFIYNLALAKAHGYEACLDCEPPK